MSFNPIGEYTTIDMQMSYRNLMQSNTNKLEELKINENENSPCNIRLNRWHHRQKRNHRPRTEPT